VFSLRLGSVLIYCYGEVNASPCYERFMNTIEVKANYSKLNQILTFNISRMHAVYKHWAISVKLSNMYVCVFFCLPGCYPKTRRLGSTEL
jgi:hypothetical protein